MLATASEWAFTALVWALYNFKTFNWLAKFIYYEFRNYQEKARRQFLILDIGSQLNLFLTQPYVKW